MATSATFTAGTTDDGRITEWAWEESQNNIDWQPIGTILNNISGETTKELTVISAEIEDDGMYVRCKATSAQGTISSNPAQLFVTATDNFVLEVTYDDINQIAINPSTSNASFNYYIDYGDGRGQLGPFTDATDPGPSQYAGEAGTQYTITISPGPGVEAGEIWFSGMEQLTNPQLLTDIVSWGNSGFVRMLDAFNGCVGLTTVTAPAGGDWSNILTILRMFQGCSDMVSIDLSAWGDWSEQHTGALVEDVFAGCSSLTSVGNLSSWRITKSRDFARMFSGCSSLPSVDLSSLLVGNTAVTDLSEMFDGCDMLTSIGDVSNWDTSKVTTLYRMFRYAGRFSGANLDVDISGWTIPALTTAESMFNFSLWTDANYHSALISFAGQIDTGIVQSNVNWHASVNVSTTENPTAEAAKQRLLTERNWTITDRDS